MWGDDIERWSNAGNLSDDLINSPDFLRNNGGLAIVVEEAASCNAFDCAGGGGGGGGGEEEEVTAIEGCTNLDGGT